MLTHYTLMHSVRLYQLYSIEVRLSLVVVESRWLIYEH